MNKPTPNYFLVNRGLLHSQRWLSEPFTRGQAWLDLFGLAQHSASYVRIRGIKVEVGRGQLAYSQLSLAARWKWSRNKVRKYLFELEKDGDLVQQNNEVTTLLTIVKYDEWQGKGQQTKQQKDNRRTTEGTHTNNDNNINNEKKENTSTNVDENFSPLPDCVEKKEKVAAAEQESSSKTEYGNPGVNEILKTIQELLGVTDFKESKKQQRMWGAHLVRLRDSLGRKEFSGRFLALQSDAFHLKNMGSLQYIYKQIKGFVGTASPKSEDIKFYNPDEDERFRD